MQNLEELVIELIEIAGITVRPDGIYVRSIKYNKDTFSEDLYEYLIRGKSEE